MEASSSSLTDQPEEEEEQQQQQREGESSLYSPCHFFGQVIKACLKCLGVVHDEDSAASTHHQQHLKADVHQHPPAQSHPHTQTEREMKFTEDQFVVMAATRSERGRRALRGRPKKKPPISSGRGGQINYSSS